MIYGSVISVLVDITTVTLCVIYFYILLELNLFFSHTNCTYLLFVHINTILFQEGMLLNSHCRGLYPDTQASPYNLSQVGHPQIVLFHQMSCGDSIL